ncbi:hypothetical protein MLD38_004337 [Melastoma candidum]|uniref:Uncharacterized protein n=1 Tax=Melastoma candidum TaxID=119954 RepID=A0ACB9S674_9MYRT|nr:hypothetical protein MLD38_004337 [Melastoma candidum]
MLRTYHNVTGLNMCSYLQQFHVFNVTKGGMIELNLGKPQPLQYVAIAAFLASLYVDCQPLPPPNHILDFISGFFIFTIVSLQEEYILGNNLAKMRYVVGYGTRYSKYVHHRATSTPHDGKKYGCQQGFKWLDNRGANPNTITGAMVAGPDKFDQFKDVRRKYSYTEPTLAGNAGLVAAFVSPTNSRGVGVDKNTIFSAVPLLYPVSSPPPHPWRP